MERLIHFLKPNRYGIHVGEKRVFPYGVAELLVQRGIASWVSEPQAVAPEPAAEVVADSDADSKPETTKRRKRSETTEE